MELDPTESDMGRGDVTRWSWILLSLIWDAGCLRWPGFTRRWGGGRRRWTTWCCWPGGWGSRGGAPAPEGRSVSRASSDLRRRRAAFARGRQRRHSGRDSAPLPHPSPPPSPRRHVRPRTRPHTHTQSHGLANVFKGNLCATVVRYCLVGLTGGVDFQVKFVVNLLRGFRGSPIPLPLKATIAGARSGRPHPSPGMHPHRSSSGRVTRVTHSCSRVTA